MDQQDHATECQHESGDLHAERPAVRFLSEEQPFVGRSHDAPDDHCDAGHHADVTPRSPALDCEQHEPQRSVLESLDERDRHALTELTVVVDAEPLMREVTAAVHHELRPEDAAERPAGDQRRHEAVGERGQ
jgi:hypothetical protein